VRGVLGLVIAAVVTLSACGDDTASDSDATSASPAASPTASPTTSTAEPPSGSTTTPPSDPQPVGVVAGQVVRGGSGPCYGVVTDDGRLYSVHSPGAGDLAVGTTVLVKLGPSAPEVDCGEGEPVTGLRIDVVG
jgi:hypothetical protein